MSQRGTSILRNILRSVGQNKHFQKFDRRGVTNAAIIGGAAHSGYAALNNVENAWHNKNLQELLRDTM